jgi:hypothetical protein
VVLGQLFALVAGEPLRPLPVIERSITKPFVDDLAIDQPAVIHTRQLLPEVQEKQHVKLLAE